MRARYFSPETGSFISQDSLLGSIAGINSQNRYTYAQNDPMNYADRSGHTIGKTSYERQMEQAGGINEIYNFYVGETLQNAQRQASAAFNGSLNSARNTDYTNMNAISAIGQISQNSVNAYIQNGALMAQMVGANYGCQSGSLAYSATVAFSDTVNASRVSVNVQISRVKANKTTQYNQYRDWLAEQERANYQRERREYVDQLRLIYGITSPYSDDYVISQYGKKEQFSEKTIGLDHNSSISNYSLYDVGNGYIGFAGEIIQNPWWELSSWGYIHNAVVDYMATIHNISANYYANAKNHFDLYDTTTKEIWEVKPASYKVPGSLRYQYLEAQLNRYCSVLEGNKRGHPFGYDTMDYGKYKIYIESIEFGKIFYTFERERTDEEIKAQKSKETRELGKLNDGDNNGNPIVIEPITSPGEDYGSPEIPIPVPVPTPNPIPNPKTPVPVPTPIPIPTSIPDEEPGIAAVKRNSIYEKIIDPPSLDVLEIVIGGIITIASFIEPTPAGEVGAASYWAWAAST